MITQFDWFMVLILSAALLCRIQVAEYLRVKADFLAILFNTLSWLAYGAAVIMFARKFTDLF